MATRPTSVGEYIAAAPEAHRDRLSALRWLCLEHAGHATEGLKWGSPAYWTETILFVFSGHAKHSNVVFTPSTLEAFRDRLGGFELGKGSVKVPYDAELPAETLGQMMAFRVREWGEGRVTWR